MPKFIMKPDTMVDFYVSWSIQHQEDPSDWMTTETGPLDWGTAGELGLDATTKRRIDTQGTSLSEHYYGCYGQNEFAIDNLGNKKKKTIMRDKIQPFLTELDKTQESVEAEEAVLARFCNPSLDYNYIRNGFSSVAEFSASLDSVASKHESLLFGRFLHSRYHLDVLAMDIENDIEQRRVITEGEHDSIRANRTIAGIDAYLA